MKNGLLILSSFLVMSSAMSASKSDHKHHHGHTKSLGTHEHGAIELEVAVTGMTIEIGLDGPAESFLGFEYAPKTDKEKKTFSDAKSLWSSSLLTKLFVLDNQLGCTASEVSFKHNIEKKDQALTKKESGVHSNIQANAKIICTQDLAGKSALVSIKKHYPHIKKLSIDVIGSNTKSYKAKSTQEIKL